MTDANTLFDLTGKVAVVTGGSRGLGKEMVLAFAHQGADVVISSRKQEACEILAKQVEAETGRRALAVACHTGHWDACDALVDTTLEAFGKIDVLVNNAGMSPLYPSLDQVSEELWDKVMAVNLKGAFRLSARVGTLMAEGEGGSIINISSMAASQPSPMEIPYGAAKAGLHALTLGMARAFAPKVRVNCIMPGPFLTDISKAWDLEAFHKAAATNIPLGRGGEPSEIVGAALYLASGASSYTTGSILKIDGGTIYSPS
ncbi:MAG: SDR family oxidoreductase [Deltaproteobacteria bacterium]|nr:SDR family oxidoreductase [Deltaproteobacteria bacterium]MBW2396035.1 SDR family oxidoreductase [Deltaproteobacteria bacterium]